MRSCYAFAPVRRCVASDFRKILRSWWGGSCAGMVSSRQSALPEDIAERLHVLQMSPAIRDKIRSGIPARRLKQLEARRASRQKTGPGRGTRRKVPLARNRGLGTGSTDVSRPRDRKRGDPGQQTMGGGGGGDGRGHRRVVPRRGFPK